MPAPALRNTTGINVFREVVVTFTPLGEDNAVNAVKDFGATGDAWPTEGVITVNIDRLALKQSNTLVNHSTAQQKPDKRRIVGETFSISIDTKVMMDGKDLKFLTGTNKLIGISCTAEKASFWVATIVESFDVTMDNPCTLSMSLRPYGHAINWDTTTVFPTS